MEYLKKKLDSNVNGVKPGMIVKVHQGNFARYGEVLGTLDNGKLLVESRPELSSLPLFKINLFRTPTEVEFVTHKSLNHELSDLHL